MPQMINGVVLVVTFGCCRLLWGSYLTLAFAADAWTALQARKSSWTQYDFSPTQKPLILEHQAVWWLSTMVMLSNAVVMALSAFWFTKMIALIKTHLNGDGVKQEKTGLREKAQ